MKTGQKESRQIAKVQVRQTLHDCSLRERALWSKESLDPLSKPNPSSYSQSVLKKQAPDSNLAPHGVALQRATC